MNTQHNSRLIILFFFFVSLYLLVLFNLYIVQIKRSDFFRSLAQRQYTMQVTSTPPRALIYDRTGVQPLALNKDSMSAFIIPAKLENTDAVNTFLSQHFKIAATRLKKNPRSHFLYIKRRLSPKEIELIEKSELTDIKLLKEPGRYYPIQSIGPLVGITDIDNQGLFGIELMCNSTLAGKPTTYLLEKDCHTFYFKRETKVEGSLGHPVTLTIDSVLQFLAYEELREYVTQIGSKEGSVLILNPENGDIMVMANYPDFNPNYTDALEPSLTKNRIVTDAYELGSVIKAFLALAALEERLVKPNELIDCENKKQGRVNGISFSTTKANGIIPFSEVIRESNNIGVAKIGQRVGTKLYDHYKRLGFSKKIGIFPGENGGSITHPSRWSKASLISLSFGYELSANILQLGQALSIIANNGYLVKPRLFLDKGVSDAPDSTSPTTGANLSASPPITKDGPLYRSEAIEQMRDILKKTVDEGAAKRAHIEGYTVMGKTGTARLITNGKYDPHRHIYTFMAIVEKGNYKRVVVIFIKETTKKGLLASSIAVPLFERVAHKMLIHDKII